MPQFCISWVCLVKPLGIRSSQFCCPGHIQGSCGWEGCKVVCQCIVLPHLNQFLMLDFTIPISSDIGTTRVIGVLFDWGVHGQNSTLYLIPHSFSLNFMSNFANNIFSRFSTFENEYMFLYRACPIWLIAPFGAIFLLHHWQREIHLQMLIGSRRISKGDQMPLTWVRSLVALVGSPRSYPTCPMATLFCASILKCF